MPASPDRVKDLFLAALEHPDAQRAAYLDEACAGDAELRQRVGILLQAHSAPDSFLSHPAIPPDATRTAAAGAGGDAPELTGTRVGRYILRRLLGEGGMGAVYEAEQTEPVRRMVAVKMIKAGLDSARVIARFEAERQVLAYMDHPGIARVLDAGTIDAGAEGRPGQPSRPYFVMELVNGPTITEYCLSRRLTLIDRLALFTQVCQAVQHAHQKGIIHRDLKPSNILVEEIDGRPQPKVIDFGLAKALDDPALETPQLTLAGQILGSPLYMAPEQAAGSTGDVDTRTDIYALGALLYELLTGTTPHDPARFRQVAWLEMLRLVREEEPAKPSDRLATDRSGEPEARSLTKLVRGDLDWIVMKALDKERSRRYDSVSGIADDVRRFLNDEPVSAGPPSARYRLRKFVRKNRRWITTASTFLALMVIASVVSLMLAIRAQRAEMTARMEAETARQAELEAQKARKAEVRAREKALRKADLALAVRGFLEEDLIGQADVLKEGTVGKPDPNLTLKSAIDRAAAKIPARFRDQPMQEASVRRAIAMAYMGRGLYRETLPHLDRAAELIETELNRGHPEDDAAEDHVELLMDITNLYAGQGQNTKALATVRRALGLAQSLAKDNPELEQLVGFVVNLRDALEGKDPTAILKKNQEMLKKLMDDHGGNPAGPKAPPASPTSSALAAVEQIERTTAIMTLMAQEKYADAEKAIVHELSRIPRDGPGYFSLQCILAEAYGAQRKFALARENYEAAGAGIEKHLGSDHPGIIACRFGLAEALLAEGQFDRAERELRAVLTYYEREVPNHYFTAAIRSALGEAMLGRRLFEEAQPLLLKGFQGLKEQSAEIPPRERRYLRDAADRLVRLYEEWKNPAEAAKWRAVREGLATKNAGT